MVPALIPDDLKPLVDEFKELNRIQAGYFWKECGVWIGAIGAFQFCVLYFDFPTGSFVSLVWMLAMGFWMRSMNPEKSIFRTSREIAYKQEQIQRSFTQRGLVILNDPAENPGVFKL